MLHAENLEDRTGTCTLSHMMKREFRHVREGLDILPGQSQKSPSYYSPQMTRDKVILVTGMSSDV